MLHSSYFLLIELPKKIQNYIHYINIQRLGYDSSHFYQSNTSLDSRNTCKIIIRIILNAKLNLINLNETKITTKNYTL